MHRTPTQREYILGGLFALMAAFPLVTSSQNVPLEGSVTGGTTAERAEQSTLIPMEWNVLCDCDEAETVPASWLPAQGSVASVEETIRKTLDQSQATGPY